MFHNILKFLPVTHAPATDLRRDSLTALKRFYAQLNMVDSVTEVSSCGFLYYVITKAS